MNNMTASSPRATRIYSAAVLAAAVIAVGWTSAPASADTPPNCTGADFAGVDAGVAAAMSSYLFTHPDVNEFITGLEESGSHDRSALQIAQYESAHPRVKEELAAIRQPLTDFDTRCGYTGKGVSDIR